MTEVAADFRATPELRVLSAWYFLYFAFLGCFGTYFGLYLNARGMTPWAIGLMLSLQPVMRMLVPYLAGWWADRKSCRSRIVAVGTSVALLVTLLIPVAQDVVLLAALIALQAMFWGAALPLVEAMTLGHLEHRVERYPSVRLWGSVGFIVAVQVGGFLLEGASMALFPWVCAALSLGVVGLSWSLRDPPSVVVGMAESVGMILRQRKVVSLMGAAFLMAAAHAPLYVFYSIHMVALGYSKTFVGFLWALGVVAEIIVFMGLPRVLARGNVRLLLLLSHGVAFARFLMIGWAGEVVWVALIAQLCHGITFGVTHGACISALSRWFLAGQQARAQSLYSSISFGGGGVVGALASGYLWDQWGAGVCFSFAAVLALAGGGLVLFGMDRVEKRAIAP